MSLMLSSGYFIATIGLMGGCVRRVWLEEAHEFVQACFASKLERKQMC